MGFCFQHVTAVFWSYLSCYVIVPLSAYTGSGAIVVQLAQPFIVDSMRMLLWDCDERTYSYTVEVSVDNSKWVMIKDNSNVPCR